jgi:hypothetical protein
MEDITPGVDNGGLAALPNPRIMSVTDEDIPGIRSE